MSYIDLSGLFATPPPNPSGRPFFTNNRVVIEIAPVNGTNVGDVPEWVDVTPAVVSAAWQEGAQDGSESRWPLGQLTLDTFALTSYIGDIFHSVSWRPAPGSPIRVSMLQITGEDPEDYIWHPQFSGFIDRFEEPDRFGRRYWRIVAYDVLWPLAGHQQIGTAAIFTTGLWELDFIIDWILGVHLLYTAAWDIEPTATLAGHVEISGNLLQLIHRLADSYGCRVWGARTGIVTVRPWIDTFRDVGHNIRNVVEPLLDGNEVYATPTWSLGVGFAASRLHVIGDDGVPDGQYANTSAFLITKNGLREDAPGWPKLDLLFSDPAQGQAIVDLTAPRFADERSLDRLDVDTIRNKASGGVISLLREWGAGDEIRFQQWGMGTWDSLVLGTSHRIDNLNSKPRWRASYFPKIIESFDEE